MSKLKKCKGVSTLIYSINVLVHTLDPFNPINKMKALPEMLTAGHLKDKPTLLYKDFLNTNAKQL